MNLFRFLFPFSRFAMSANGFISHPTQSTASNLARIFFVGLLLLAFGAQYAEGATKTWIGGNSTWNTNANWSPSGVPGSGDDVIINTSSAIAINITSTINTLTITTNATVTFTSSGSGRTITIDNTGSSINSGSSLTLQGSTGSGTRSMTIAFSGTARTMNIAGTLKLTAVGEGTIYNATNSSTTVTGTIINDGTGGGTAGVINSTTSNLSFSSSGTYQHALDGGTIPTATWNAASTCTITGMTATSPSGFAQTFGNFTWNCASQTGTVSIAGNITVKGNFNLIAGKFTLSQDNNNIALTIAGNYTQTGGIFDFDDGTGPNYTQNTLFIAGNFSNTVNSTGNMTVSGMSSYSEYNGIIVFNGTTTQTVSFTNANAAQWIDYTINATSSIQLQSNLALYDTGTSYNKNEFFTVNGSLDVGTFIISDQSGSIGSIFTLNSGSSIVTAHTQGLSTTAGIGSIQVTGTRTFGIGANYIYNGTTAQVTGNGLTGANNLTINNTAGVTLSGAATVSGTLTLTNGTLTTTTTNLLSVTNTAITAITGGSSTSFINGPLKWTLPASLASGSTYTFPVGAGTTYLPFSLVNPTTGTGTITAQVQAFQANSGGTTDATLAAKSATEYWSLTTAGNFTNSSVSLIRSTEITPYSVIAGSGTQTGIYTNLAGTASIYGVSTSNAIGTNRFFTLGQLPGSSFWLKADAGTSSTSDGVAVSTWNDQSGIANNATSQLTAPTYQSIGSNFNPSISFSNGYYLTTANQIANDMTFFAVYNSTQSTGSTSFWLTPAIIGGETASTTNDYTLSTNYGKLYFKGTATNNFDAQTTGIYNDGIAKIVSVTRPKSAVDSIRLYVNGTQVAHALSDNYSLTGPTKLGIGNAFAYQSAAQFTGGISEVRGINSVYTTSTRQNFESYLALKYGVSLSHDYTNGSGTVVYSISGYANNIAGLGNDATYGLNQKVSASINLPVGTSSRVAMATTNDYTSSNLAASRTALSNGQYLIWGDDNTATNTWITSGIYSIVNRKWKVQNTGSVGAINFWIDLTGFPAPASGTYTLLVDNDGNFSNGGTTEYTLRNVSGSLYTATVTFPSGTSYFTIAGFITPVITVSPTSLSGFTYPFGAGPSGEQSFTVSGTHLTANVTLTPPSHYEISTGTGGSFVATNPITLAVSGGTLSSTTIHVRLKAGLAQASYNLDSINIASTNATTQHVVCNGTVTVGPVITVSPATLTGLDYTYTLGPSTQQTVNVSGTNLLGNVTITPPSDFEISTTSGSGFVSTPITITASGTLASTPVYIRMKTGLGVGSYTQNVVVSSPSAPSQNVSCTGTVSPAATIFNPISLLSTFIYTVGSGPSGVQPFTVSGTTLTAGITITPPANFEISQNSGGSFQTTALTLPQSGGIINTTTIYVRMVSGLAAGNYGPSNIMLSSAGATPKSVSCSGSVVNTATILVSKSSLTGFGYQAAQGGPSSDQNFTVSGSSLSTNITIAPPSSYYEISLTSGSGYQSTNIILTQTSGKVDPTIIYVRLKSGYPAGDYTGTITASAGTPTKSIGLVGKVFASPLITATSTPGSPYCLGSTITLVSTGADIQNRYWQGPNNYYSIDSIPVLTTNATTSLSGTYTVTGNVTVGGNLVTNGDFEAGNTSFGSGYTYVAPTTNALYPEGLYTVTSKPSNVHDQFNSVGDHTTGTGQQMVVNGNSVAGVVVWTQSVPVIPGASYQFTYWEQTVNLSNISPSQLQLYVNGVSAGPVYTATVPNGNWSQFLYNALAGSNTVLNLELINENTIANGNDFALDDIVFQQILSATASTDVSVAASVPVSVSIAASANPVTQGATVTYTATPTNGGTSPTYAWYKNGAVVSGVTGSTYSYVPASNDQIYCVLTSSITCTTGNPATSNTVTMTVNPVANYWRGTNGTDWGTASNWTANTIPLAGDNVVYASSTNGYGSDAINDLQVDGNRTIGSLINATSKKLIIPAAKSLTVNNTITTNANNPDLIQIQASASAANGTLIFHNAQTAPVYATVQMYSMAYKSASPDVLGYYYKWQYFGIPINTVVANPTFYGSYIRRWVESGDSISNHWLSVDNNFVLQPFYAYEITQQTAKTIVFQGQLVNWDWTSPALPLTATALFPGQNLLANPYTAAINILNIVFGSDMQAAIYLYSTGSYGDWSSFSTTGNSPGQWNVTTPGTVGTLGIPTQIPSMQGFMVQVNNATSNATITIPYSAVVNNTEQQRVKSTNETAVTDKVGLRIDVAGSITSDKMWLIDESTCTRNFDNGWDGRKIMGYALSPQLYAVEPDGNYQIDCVNNLDNTKLAFQAGVDTEYTMTITAANIKRAYTGLYLQDLVDNKTIEIADGTTKYSFSALSTPTPTNRFKIITRTPEQNAPDLNSTIKIFSNKGTIFVQNTGSSSGNVLVFDIAGRYLQKQPIVPYGITTVYGLIPGAYIAKAIAGSEDISKRLIVR